MMCHQCHTNVTGCSCLSELVSRNSYRLIYQESLTEISQDKCTFLQEYDNFIHGADIFSELNAGHIFLGCAGDCFSSKWYVRLGQKL